MNKNGYEKVGDVELVGPTANIGFSRTVTSNLGNYESVKTTITLHYPITIDPSKPLDEEAIEGRFAELEKWVDDRMDKLLIQVGAGSR